MPLINTYNVALVFIIGAEIIHLFQLKYTPDIIHMDEKPEEIQEKYSIRDIYPFLLIELLYLAALVYLLFSNSLLLFVYASVLLLLGLVKLAFFKKIQNRHFYIKVDSSLTALVTTGILLAYNLKL